VLRRERFWGEKILRHRYLILICVLEKRNPPGRVNPRAARRAAGGQVKARWGLQVGGLVARKSELQETELEVA
jgi:hypothetical protein